MPTFSRQSLRRTLGEAWLFDTIVGTTTHSWNQAGGSINIIDARLADLSLSGQGRNVGAWLKFEDLEARVASFNSGTGAFLSQGNVVGLSASFGQGGSGAPYEVHSLLTPTAKDRALDDAVQRIRVRQEVGITTVSGALFYDLDTAASPYRIARVLGAYVFADPSNTGNRDRRDFHVPPRVVETATGAEIRLDTDLSLSSLLVVDALLELTLGSADTATINIPDERWVLAGAAAKAWDLLAQKAPGTNAAQYRANRDDAARTFSDLSARYKPVTAAQPSFEVPY